LLLASKSKDPNAMPTFAAEHPEFAGFAAWAKNGPWTGGPCRDINFDPTVLPAGIKTSNDPFPAARSSVYAKSYDRRTEIGKRRDRLHRDAFDLAAWRPPAWQSRSARHRTGVSDATPEGTDGSSREATAEDRRKPGSDGRKSQARWALTH
jgi:hypothetical protein